MGRKKNVKYTFCPFKALLKVAFEILMINFEFKIVLFDKRIVFLFFF